MIFFVIRYLFIALFLFSIIENINPISEFLNEYQTNLTMFFLSFFIDNNIIEGTTVIINSAYKVLITDECNGLLPLISIFSAILAYSAPIMHKIKWLIYIYVVYFIINVLRILIVIYVAFEYGYKSFFWTHDIFGNGLLISFGLLSFYFFIKTIKKVSI